MNRLGLSSQSILRCFREGWLGKRSRQGSSHMTGHFVFVRFFLDYTKCFPFERFLHLDDGDIHRAVEALCREWLSEPANAARLQELRQLRERQRQEVLWSSPRYDRTTTIRFSAPAKPDIESQASFEEVALVAGWGKPTRYGDWNFGISRRYPVARFDRNEDAAAAAVAIQERVTELARSACAKDRVTDQDRWLRSANPRFFVVTAKQLPRAEFVMTLERLHRLNGPAGAHQCPEEAFLRLFLPMIRSTLAQVEALSTPVEAVADSEASHIMAGDCGSTTDSDSAQPRQQVDAVKKKRRRGRKPDTDFKDDQRIFDAWMTGSYRTYNECARTLGKTEKQVRDAIDRHRHRRRGKKPIPILAPE
jgi:uncharacterized protein YukE